MLQQIMSISKKKRLLLLAGMVTTIPIVSLVMYAVAGRRSATTSKAPTVAKTGPAPKTPWGEPDLQGIWSRDVDAPLGARATDFEHYQPRQHRKPPGPGHRARRQ